jgi:hypothetical protein
MFKRVEHEPKHNEELAFNGSHVVDLDASRERFSERFALPP